MRDKKIVIIGAGKISYSLANALIQGGFRVSLVISKKISSAKKLALKFGIKSFSNKIENTPAKDCLVFLTVPDIQIEKVARELLKVNKYFSNSIVVHLSGALDSSVLNHLKNRGAQTASFHIMQTFPSHTPVPVKGCFAAIETEDAGTEKFLFALARKIYLKPFKLKAGEKVYYHIAGVFASNFLTGNFFAAQKLFGKNKINLNELILPIVSSTLSNIQRGGAADALSGPVERGDIETVKVHINALKQFSNRCRNYTLLLNYLSQSLNLLHIVKTKSAGLSPDHLAIQRLLIRKLKNLPEKFKP